MATVLSVNVGRERPNPHKESVTTGIDKRPVQDAVLVRAPGSKADGLGSGLVGDVIGDRTVHGGDDQAVYAYARESLDTWAEELGRELTSGVFGENLTTTGLDVDGALIGERWAVGDELVLQVTSPRVPCATFQGWLEEQHWVKRFTAAARPGTYLRVVTPGHVRAGDEVRVVHRPDHDVTTSLVFRAYLGEPDLIPAVLVAEDLPAEDRAELEARYARRHAQG